MIPQLNILGESRRLKQTTSRCPVCLEPIPAEVHERHGRIIMSKACPEHGHFEVTIADDPRFYHLSRGAPENAS
ncbi:MAG: hypothetical protein IIA64_11525, partial [Planctomycetes bacterium]|nr:hypothetical protein [Planctomycetota bacterium]